MAAKPQTVWRERLTQAWLRRGLLAWLLWPISVLLGVLSALRRQLYRAGWLKAARVPVPVIVVGNVLAGGSGKTPVVMTLVEHFVTRGLKVGVISRGYGRLTHDCREVTLDCAVTDVGDEPALIKHTTHVPVFVAARRIEAARALLARYPDTQVILSDDGLQHLALHRDLEICVFDNRGVGNGFLLPAGPLREPWPRRVDWVLHTGTSAAFAGFKATRTMASLARRADGSTVPLIDLKCPPGRPLMALAAIAKPEDFFTMLRAQGLTLARTLALPDHDDFNGWVGSNSEGHTLLCTEKDAVKLWRQQPDALAVPLVLTLPRDFLTQLDAKLARHLDPTNPTLSFPHGHTTS